MSGFLLRWLVAFLLLAATYNPTEYNYIAWAQANFATSKPLVIGLGVMLALALLIYVVAAVRTLGLLGLFLLVVIMALLGYILVGNGTLQLELNSFNIWGCAILLSLILGATMSWRSPSKIRAQAKKAQKARSTAKPANA
ncbi:DUF6524 family protein [Rhodovulum sulfidophilum]|uniref:DUF6524 family protein n=1 Tax=Rhodovulum sulfidophilum TaxID=35806 RepID=UPI000952D7CC|nr:DUF6524 family protein [Rhodovulum sulfidophilum]MBK5922490.1 hypothetical protein [Rhodovulum sulfidophilum]MBL3551920.1 hypothetical protein [Rhodovulum sulfidophilum]MBL3561964.1 hypothetical protein [Rhodovulum sulfidophilum]OLS49918.1 hypothetical protein BV379_17655 [Rhodovulum sulfidophilum]